MRAVVLAVVLVAALGIGGLRLGGPEVVDSWPVGGLLDCSDGTCPAMIATGLAALDRRDPAHAAVTSSVLHRIGTCRDPKTGDTLLINTGGGPVNVLLVEEADGSRHAIGVGYPGISQTPMSFDHFTCPGSG